MHTNLEQVQYHTVYCSLGLNRKIKTMHFHINAVSIALIIVYCVSATPLDKMNSNVLLFSAVIIPAS